jgi:hydrogenase maturation protein HypF
VAKRLRLALRGAVQGVGFRPFVYRLARDRQLGGWCRNSPHGVLIEVEGERATLDEFRLVLEREPPPRAAIQGIEGAWLDPVGLPPFEIQESEASDHPSAVVIPDIALCESCRGELLNPDNRRYRYPFINCTNCGPRYSIIEALPYDRANTSMRAFAMCPACDREYRDPLDRRFHAEPNACPVCGPHVSLWDATGAVVAERDHAMIAAANAIRAGKIVAVKGLGGFQLLVDATDEAAVGRLRQRKHRDEKPFAIMCPDIECVHQHARVGPAEARLLASPEAPIVLLETRTDHREPLAPSVAPGSRHLGAMLPYTPLHVLLMRDVLRPIVATSGNHAEEPICIDEREVVARLGHIADLYLVHDRPIVRHVDDSVVRVVRTRELMIRRARGYAPWPIDLGEAVPAVVGVGAHLKNTVAITAGRALVVSQHIGDLATPRSLDAFHDALDSLTGLYRVTPEAVAVDLHPDYLSTQHGRALGVPVTTVQHHYAHLAACMADNDLTAPVVGAVWDGSGYGTDGTVWGGEFLRATADGFERVACLRPFRLPGGEAAVREPRRSALGLLTARGGDAVDRWRRHQPAAFSEEEWRVIGKAIRRGLNAPVTSSIGRLLDAATSIMGVRHVMRFEGQAAMQLEQLVDARVHEAYPFGLVPPDPAWRLGTWQAPGLVVDWAPIVDALLDDVDAGTDVGVMAACLHNTLAEVAVAVALALGESRLLLTGGCFQNRYLTEQAAARLEAMGVRPYWHQRLPPNDGGIAAGQIVAWLRAPRPAARPLAGRTRETRAGGARQGDVVASR